MGRAPCCDKANVKRGPWSPEEDAKLKDYMGKHGTGGNWIALPQKAGLRRCGKSCRLRWLNYLRPNIKHGEFSDHEDRVICTLFANIGSRWSIIAAQLPGRTDNDIKNYWNTKLKKKLLGGYYINPNNPSLGISPAPEQQHNHFGVFSPAIQTLSVLSPSAPDFYDLSPFDSSSSSSATTLQPQDQTLVGSIDAYIHGSSDGSSHRDQHHLQVTENDLQGFSSPYYGNDEIFGGNGEIVNYDGTATALDYYGIEEIKQLISTTSSSSSSSSCSSSSSSSIALSGNNCSNYSEFLFDIENRATAGNAAGLATGAEEGFLYYY